MSQNIKNNTIFALIALLLVFLRLPAIFKETAPYLFCDEGIYFGETNRLYQSKQWITGEFRAGGVNIYFPLIALRVIGLFTRLSADEVLLIGRFIMLVLLALGSLYYIYKTSAKMFESKVYGWVSAFLYVISPYTFSMSRYWYPDHYIIFFSAGLLYYLTGILKSRSLGRSDIVGLAIFFALTVSTKYTGLAAGVAILTVIAFLPWRCWPSAIARQNFYNLFLIPIIFITSFSLINFSIFTKFYSFIDGFMYNVVNYGEKNIDNYDGAIFYVAVLYILTFGFLGTPFFIDGYRRLFFKNKAIFFTLIGFPISIILAIGFPEYVLNRSVSVLVPFIIPVISYSIVEVNRFAGRFQFWRWVFYAYAAVFVAVLVSDTFSAALADFRADSRRLAAEWIRENVPKQASVGHNEFCSGQSPASGFIKDLKADPSMELGLDYYVFNSYWKSRISDLYWSSGLLQQRDQRLLHFHNFNDRRLVRDNEISAGVSGRVEALLVGYRVIKEINSSGPTIYVLKRLD